MGLPGIFETYQLAIGPSTVYTSGALRIGQAFRELLISSPYRFSNRILIELTGNFSKFGRENNSGQAVIAGLGGFSLEQPLILRGFYGKIRENGCFSFPDGVWPFNPESDLIFNDSDKNSDHSNCIRFHLLSDNGQPVFQAEYFSERNGLVRGPGLPETRNLLLENYPKSLHEIKQILNTERISLVEYVISGECSRHRISRDQFQKRMMATWKLMIAHIDRGIKAQNLPTGALSSGPFAGSENSKAALYAVALSEDVLNNKPIITAPTCTGSAIVPAVFRYIQEKFMFSDEKMVEGLITAGLFGSLILDRLNQEGPMAGMQDEIAFSAIMAAAGVTFLMGGTSNETDHSAALAAELYGSRQKDRISFEPKAFLLQNFMISQTLPALADLSRIQEDILIPEFDTALKDLFRR